MGNLFKSLALLSDGEVHEVSASDLVTGYVGQAGMKTRELLSRSKGGVLFIDEAYQLDPQRGGPYMTEAVDELVKCLTSDDFYKKVLVVLAGYEEDIERMLRVNEGLKSRFSERLMFANLESTQAARMLLSGLAKKNMPLSDTFEEDRLGPMLKSLTACDDFANGRDVQTLVEGTYQIVAKRCKGRGRNAKVDAKDLQAAISKLRSQRGDNKLHRFPDPGPLLPHQMMEAKHVTPVPDKVALATCKAQEISTQETPVEETADLGLVNPFSSIDETCLLQIQEFVNEQGINTAEGVKQLAVLSRGDPKFQDLRDKLVSQTGMSPEKAVEVLTKWQDEQKNLQEKLHELQQGSQGMEAIWRCAVCGRGGYPWIVCYVAPYIECYRPTTERV